LQARPAPVTLAATFAAYFAFRAKPGGAEGGDIDAASVVTHVDTQTGLLRSGALRPSSRAARRRRCADGCYEIPHPGVVPVRDVRSAV
jgi:hypothetical protein